jgi:hypothetical protein
MIHSASLKSRYPHRSDTAFSAKPSGSRPRESDVRHPHTPMAASAYRTDGDTDARRSRTAQQHRRPAHRHRRTAPRHRRPAPRHADPRAQTPPNRTRPARTATPEPHTGIDSQAAPPARPPARTVPFRSELRLTDVRALTCRPVPVAPRWRLSMRPAGRGVGHIGCPRPAVHLAYGARAGARSPSFDGVTCALRYRSRRPRRVLPGGKAAGMVGVD